jgi:hypothetical protein
MIAQSKIVAKNDNATLTVTLKMDSKPGSAGLLARLTNRYYEQLFEFFNCNQITAAEFCHLIKADPVKK